jgi:hypothetical protein
MQLRGWVQMQRQQIVLMTADTFCNSIRLDVKFLLTNAATFCCLTRSPHQGSGWMTAANFWNSTKPPHQCCCLLTAATKDLISILFCGCHLLQVDYRNLLQCSGGWLLPPFVTRLRLYIKVSVWWLLPPFTARLYCRSPHQDSGGWLLPPFCNSTKTPHQGFC